MKYVVYLSMLGPTAEVVSSGDIAFSVESNRLTTPEDNFLAIISQLRLLDGGNVGT